MIAGVNLFKKLSQTIGAAYPPDNPLKEELGCRRFDTQARTDRISSYSVQFLIRCRARVPACAE